MKTKLEDGIYYPVLTADENGFINCPFCHKKHKHGKPNGHRMAHCDFKEIGNQPSFIDGSYFFQSRGYFIEHIKY